MARRVCRQKQKNVENSNVITDPKLFGWQWPDVVLENGAVAIAAARSALVVLAGFSLRCQTRRFDGSRWKYMYMYKSTIRDKLLRSTDNHRE